MSNDGKPLVIQPTVGRVVYYYPSEHDVLYKPGYAEPRAAIVVRVWNDRMVNLSVADTEGNWQGRTSVALVQEGDEAPAGRSFCQWMKFQLDQASKHAGEGT